MEEKSEGASRGGRAKDEPAESAHATQEIARKLLFELTSADYFTRVPTHAPPSGASEQLADELIRAADKSADIAAFPSVAQALESMGKAALPAILRALAELEIRKPRDVYLLECLLDSLPEGRDRRISDAAARFIDRCRSASAQPADAAIVPLLQHARSKAHVLLSEMDDRARLDDLIALAKETGPHLRPEIIDALYEIGDKRAVPLLLRSHETQESLALKDDIRDATLQVMRREGLTPESEGLPRLSQTERATLAKLWPRPRNGQAGGNGNGGANGNGASAVSKAPAQGSPQRS